MAILTTAALWFASVATLSSVLSELKQGPLIRWYEMKPLNRTILQSYTVDRAQSDTGQYIIETVREIYGLALTAAALRKEGYNHPFNPLLPIHVYPFTSYVPKILDRLRLLFPECDVEMDQRLGIYVIKWF